MAALTQASALTGSRGFTLRAAGSSTAARPSNGSKWFMRKKGSYMVEVSVGETESEDFAVRRFMKSVMMSGVIDELRARRRVETKIEYNKRKLFERAQAKRLVKKTGEYPPSWFELYGKEENPQPFDDFFKVDENGEIPYAEGSPDSLPGFLPEDVDNFQMMGSPAGYQDYGQGYGPPAGQGYMTAGGPSQNYSSSLDYSNQVPPAQQGWSQQGYPVGDSQDAANLMGYSPSMPYAERYQVEGTQPDLNYVDPAGYSQQQGYSQEWQQQQQSVDGYNAQAYAEQQPPAA